MGNNAAKAGIVKLPIDNPYDAPPGAIVVVAAGSPGTSYKSSNRFADDISVAAGNGQFINDHPAESYGGSRAAFANGVGASNPGHPGNVLGVYVPHGYVWRGRQY